MARMSTMFQNASHQFFTIVLLLVVALTATASVAQVGEPGSRRFGPKVRHSDQVKVTVFADTDRVKPLKTFHLVILFDIADTWHLYWKNPGAGAAPITVEIKGPMGFQIDAPLWPRPSIFPSSTGDMYGYAGQIALFVPITASEHFNVEAFLLHYDINWAVCDDQRCLIQSQKGTISVIASLPFADDEKQTQLKRLVDQHTKRLPIPAADDDDVEVAVENTTLTMTGPARGFVDATFIANPSPGVSFGKPDLQIADDQFTLTVEIIMQPRNFVGTSPVAGGLVVLGEKPDDPSYEFSVPLRE